MSQIKEVLRLHHEAKLAYSQIALACGLSKGAVSKYLNLAKAQDIGWPLPQSMDEAQLESRLFADNKPPRRFVEPSVSCRQTADAPSAPHPCPPATASQYPGPSPG